MTRMMMVMDDDDDDVIAPSLFWPSPGLPVLKFSRKGETGGFGDFWVTFLDLVFVFY